MTELSPSRFPFTGPLYSPMSPHPASKDRSTVKGLKRAMIRLGYLDQPLGHETDDFGIELEKAFKAWFKKEYGLRWTYYGLGSWKGLRGAKMTEGPNRGRYAMDSLALQYVRADQARRCYPHPLGAGGEVGQGLHPTYGIPGNWAIDFLAPGGTKVLAVEHAVISRLSGHPPSDGANQGIGIFGWSIYYDTPDGCRYFSTHYGSTKVHVGEPVNCGEVIGTVGNWPGEPTRSHTHLGVTSPLGQAAAKRRITEVSEAQRVAV